MEGQKEKASGRGLLKWKGAGEGIGKETMKVKGPKSGLLASR